MSRFLVLGTGQAQVDLIKALIAQGDEVYACSYMAGDAGETFVHHFSQINITDEDRISQYAKDNHIEYIYSVGSDIAMPTVASVAANLSLKSFISPETAYICHTKQVLRQTLGQDFVGNIRFQSISSIDEALEIPFPFVIKPVDSQGQRGVYKVENLSEFVEKFPYSQRFSRSGKLIAEEFVDGDEISVNTFSVDGHIAFILMSDRITWEDLPGGIIHKHRIPSKYESDEQIKNRVYHLVTRVQQALSITEGPAYFQIKIDKEGNPKLIEVTPRLDGCHMWRLIRYSTGVDLLDMSIALLKGRPVHVPEYSVLPYTTEFLCLPPGAVFQKELFSFPRPVYIQWYYADHAIVKSTNGYMEKCGFRIYQEE